MSLIRKTHQQKDFWLSQGGAKKYIKFIEYPCHAHSVQAIIDDYFGALKSFFQRHKIDPKARPPYRSRKFHTFTWRATGISCKDGKMQLSMGKGREPIVIPVEKLFLKVPVEVSMVYNRDSRCYQFHATYQVELHKSTAKTRNTVAIDMGEIHPIVAFDGANAAIYNGKSHRAIIQYRQKFLACINRKLSRCKRYSKRWKQLKATKCRVLANQLRDCRHKITSRFVSTCRKDKVQTIVIGNLTHIRQSTTVRNRTRSCINGPLLRLGV